MAMNRKDPAWKYAKEIEGKKNYLRCIFCDQRCNGGISKLKHRLDQTHHGTFGATSVGIPWPKTPRSIPAKKNPPATWYEYLGIENIRFHFNCTQCSAGIVLRTNPQLSRVLCESNATLFCGDQLPGRLPYGLEELRPKNIRGR
ncbi:unknown function family protein DUF572 [Prunus dulcis]|uniref:BED-type domain-containing protein n=1 Tax=Prunus dulcis TaxID=3755 RepID=A0A4Y1R192_PRUDU|nr:unknown function family protein DUF572 [Prunus dulcis]